MTIRFGNSIPAKLLTVLAAVSVLFLQLPAQTDRRLERPGAARAGEKRLALVIGNGAYKKAKPLANPGNDAADMAKALSEVGFEVLSGTDLDKRRMEILIRDFGNKLAASGGVGLFYYAGHGVQVGGENYLVPTDADIPEEDEVAYSAVPVSLVLSKMASAKNDLNIVILDACRDNPFARSWRRYRSGGSNDGLAKISPPTGTLVLYATEPGKVASDGTARNGLFTEALLKQIRRPGLEYDQMVKTVSADVWQRSDRQQLPWKEGNTLRDFYFAPAGTSAVRDPAPASPTTTGAVTPGTVRKNSIGMELVWIPPGEFMMGSENGHADEKPVRRITIGKGFWMGKYEVTQGQWQALMGDNPSHFKDCGTNCPVENVSWNDAKVFISQLNLRNDGFVYSLPSEAQWEYAARAGTTGDYHGKLDDIAWYANNSGRLYYDAESIWKNDQSNYSRTLNGNGNRTHPVGGKRPNAFGLYDMLGNVAEWCEDWYHDSVLALPTDESANLTRGEQKFRVLRGGMFDGLASGTRSAFRFRVTPDFYVRSYGFRVVARLN